jgi:hypothetical protein
MRGSRYSTVCPVPRRSSVAAQRETTARRSCRRRGSYATSCTNGAGCEARKTDPIPFGGHSELAPNRPPDPVVAYHCIPGPTPRPTTLTCILFLIYLLRQSRNIIQTRAGIHADVEPTIHVSGHAAFDVYAPHVSPARGQPFPGPADPLPVAVLLRLLSGPRRDPGGNPRNPGLLRRPHPIPRC